MRTCEEIANVLVKSCVISVLYIRVELRGKEQSDGHKAIRHRVNMQEERTRSAMRLINPL